MLVLHSAEIQSWVQLAALSFLQIIYSGVSQKPVLQQACFVISQNLGRGATAEATCFAG